MSESTSQAAPEKKSVSAHAHGEGEHHHNENEYPYVAHHFDSPAQQFDAGKLGIWLFLVTEILFFAGLFCAYTIYRARYPEVFYWAHFFLDTKWGAINTIVLILSSLTAAWAVRNAQLGQQKLLVINILITIGCACTFMGVKYVEYSHKAHAGLLPGPAFNPQEQLWQSESFKAKHPESAAAMERLTAGLEAHRAKIKAAEAAQAASAAAAPAGTAAPAAGAAPAEAAPAPGAAPAEEATPAAEAAPPSAIDAPAGVQPGAAAPTEPVQQAEAEKAEGEKQAEGAEKAEAEGAEKTEGADRVTAAPEAGADDGVAKPAEGTLPEGDPGVAEDVAAPAAAPAAAAVPAVKMPVSEDIFLATEIRRLNETELKPLLDAGIIKTHPADGPQLERPARAHMFFSIYFFMTGLHGIHVLIGIIVWVWLLLRAMKGQFGPLYFGPIDFAALYWHLVDLIWIYLFPLLYLIH